MYQDFELSRAPLSSFYAPCTAAAVYVALVVLHAALKPSGIGEVKLLRGELHAPRLGSPADAPLMRDYVVHSGP